jgi:hypothetical protein
MGSISFLMNALITGLLLGGFYAAISLGLTLSFGLLDIVNIAHVEFILLGSYLALLINQWFGVDLVVSGIILTPLFFALGMLLYRFYYFCFEKRGQESLRGLAFFFGILFVIEVLLVLAFGVDFRTGKISYVDTNWKIGDVDFPLRLLVPFVVSVAMVIALQAYLTRTFFGRAVMAVAQDRLALGIAANGSQRDQGARTCFRPVHSDRRPRWFPADRNPAGRAFDGAKLHWARVCRMRAGRDGKHIRHAHRSDRPGYRGKHYRCLPRSFVGRYGRVRRAIGHTRV